MISCKDCIHACVCPLADGAEYRDIDNIRSDCEYFVRAEEVENLIYKLECLLFHATGGKLSKHTYDLLTMEKVVTDYIQEAYEDGYKDGNAMVSRKIFEEIEFDIAQLDFDREETRAIAIEGIIAARKKKYTGGE